jgi:fatty-acyl-CoA synthase
MTPGRVAFVQGDRSRTYAELADRTRRLAGALHRRGVEPGDRVAFLGRNDIATFETFFATGLAGAVFVPLNTRLSAAEITHLLTDCGASVLVHGPEMSELLAEVDLPARVAHVLTADELEAAVREAPGDLPDNDITLDDPCLILYTSGTTGRPKGAVLTHGNLTWNTINQLGHVDILSTDTALCIAPLFHVTGLGQVSLPTLFKGGTVVVAPRFDAGEVLATIAREHITAFSAVPTMLKLMCEHPSWPESDLGSLRHVIYGGSPVEERVALAWLDRGVQVLQGYGMTEASPGVYMGLREGQLAHPVSIGVPHFFTDVAFPAGETVTAPEPDRAAELLVRGPNVFTGYWNRPEDTAATFVDGQWFRTGDVVRVGDDGWAYAVDRVKDMIISGGENIYPAEVEAVLVTLDAVADCAVVAVPDERWGEVGLAYVVPRDGAALTEDGLRAHLGARLARYKVPKHVRFVDELPRNATGKLRRADLRQRARDELGSTTTTSGAAE